MYAYTVAQGLVHVLKACGDNLTRENVMKQAASIKDLELGGLLPGIKVNTVGDRLRPDLAAAADEVQGRELGAVRRDPQRRRRRLAAPSLPTKEAAPAASPQGLFVVGFRQMVFNRAASKELRSQESLAHSTYFK